MFNSVHNYKVTPIFHMMNWERFVSYIRYMWYLVGCIDSYLCTVAHPEHRGCTIIVVKVPGSLWCLPHFYSILF